MTNLDRIAAVVAEAGRPVSAAEIARAMKRNLGSQVSRAHYYGLIKLVSDQRPLRYVPIERQPEART